ncbi:MAG: hypothetical protein QOE90_1028 [Thermoplasmata archaeon]|jgi:hypothetical protein|nr:hypothetical protein [Thermoplasmata archaeon]
MDSGETVQQDELRRTLEALSSPTRLWLLARLATPGFVTGLANELGVSRQATQKHLDALTGAGLVQGRLAWRGTVRAVEYVASPAGIFAFRETLHGLTGEANTLAFPLTPTRPSSPSGFDAHGVGPGLLLVHGDVPGRWYPLEGRSEWIVGRAAQQHVCLAYDPFASAQHALLRRGPEGWRIADLRSRNGTRVNLRPLPPGGVHPLRQGDLITVGRSHLIFREGSSSPPPS